VPTPQNNDQFLSVHTFAASNADILLKISGLDNIHEASKWTALTFWHRSFTFNSNKSPT